MGIAIQLISVLFPNSPMRWKFSGLLCKYPSSKESGQSGVELCHAVDWRSEGHFQLLISMFGQWIFKDLQSWKAKGLWNIPQHATASWTWRSFMIFLRTNKEIWHWKLPNLPWIPCWIRAGSQQICLRQVPKHPWDIMGKHWMRYVFGIFLHWATPPTSLKGFMGNAPRMDGWGHAESKSSYLLGNNTILVLSVHDAIMPYVLYVHAMASVRE